MELVHGHESHLALSNRDVPSILDASFKFTRPSCLIATKVLGHLCVWSKKYLEESCVTSAVIGVFVGLTFASVLMRRKWISRSRFVQGESCLPYKRELRGLPGRVAATFESL